MLAELARGRRPRGGDQAGISAGGSSLVSRGHCSMLRLLFLACYGSPPHAQIVVASDIVQHTCRILPWQTNLTCGAESKKCKYCGSLGSQREMAIETVLWTGL